jgi:hypothetical protein
MVKKLEMGITVACTRSLEEKVKDLRNVKRREQKRKINTVGTCSPGQVDPTWE